MVIVADVYPAGEAPIEAPAATSLVEGLSGTATATSSRWTARAFAAWSPEGARATLSSASAREYHPIGQRVAGRACSARGRGMNFPDLVPVIKKSVPDLRGRLLGESVPRGIDLVSRRRAGTGFVHARR